MAELFASGRIVDLILLLVVIEVMALALVRAKSARGLALRDLLGGLAPGVFLLLALRSTMMLSGWSVTAFWLAIAFAAHVADLSRRWKS